jgi:hypothetical protein
MASAIDMFREQREAAEQLRVRVQEIGAFLGQLRQQVNTLALNEGLRTLLREEQDWLTRAQLASPRFARFASRTCCGSGPACSDDGPSPWYSRWHRRQPQARAMRGGRSRTRPNSPPSAHGRSSRASSSTAFSR